MSVLPNSVSSSSLGLISPSAIEIAFPNMLISLALTVTVKSSFAETFPFTSVAVQVTVVTPTLNTWFVSVVTVPVVAPVST